MPMNQNLSSTFPDPIWLMDPTCRMLIKPHQKDVEYWAAADEIDNNKISSSSSYYIDNNNISSSYYINNNARTTTYNNYHDMAPQYRLPDREPMFEKPLTPSDVGKLNRLVIPKQHAERHFPLTGEPVENGLLLCFEDESGKCWRFRYSYWNSSQSYVLTKGWSRYVKEKRLDAGDVVLFERHRADSDRFFIGWRRKGAAPPPPPPVGLGLGRSRDYYNAPPGCYPAEAPLGLPLPPAAGSGARGQRRTATCSSMNNNSKTLRLFGVNLECRFVDDEEEEGEPMSKPRSSSLQGQVQDVEGQGHEGRACNYLDYVPLY